MFKYHNTTISFTQFFFLFFTFLNDGVKTIFMLKSVPQIKFKEKHDYCIVLFRKKKCGIWRPENIFLGNKR